MTAPEVHTLTTPAGDTATLSYAPLDPALIEERLRNESDGAVVSFVGYTRDNFQGRRVTHLTYDAYVPLALKTLVALFAEARALPPPEPFSHAAPSAAACCPRSGSGSGPHTHEGAVELGRMHVAHLLGPSPPKTPSIVVAVSAPHRREAFFLAEWLLERTKERVQVWKREWYADAEGEGGFVGRDGDGPEGRGGRAHEAGSRWKENFPPAPSTAPAAVSGEAA